MAKIEFPNAPILAKLSKDLVQFHGAADPCRPDLWVYDETIEIIPLCGKQATVNAYLWKTGRPDLIVLPEIDVHNKLLKFNSVSDEDEVTIFGNHYEIQRTQWGCERSCDYEWSLYP